MPSQGPRFPGTASSLANAGTSENAEAWVSPGNITADDGSNASITAATYDSPDISQLLIGSNFGFTIPNDAGIVGIVVEIERNNAAGAASDNRVQLARGTAFADLVGDNKADTALDWPAAMTVASYGSASDLWGTTWTPDQINASSFAVFMSVQADAANTDVAVDFYRVTVHYVEPTARQGHPDAQTFPPGRLMPRQLVVETRGEPAAAPVTETPTPGGAIGQGVSPIAVVTETAQGALGAGAGPVADALAASGGGPASGFAVTPTVPVTPGGSTGTGVEGTAVVPVTPGGAIAGGVSPIVPVFETPTPGGAIAGGNSPIAVATSNTGTATAGGAGPSAQAVAGQAGSPATGFAPNAATSVTPGGSTGAGNTSAALVGVTPGGAVSGGNAPAAPLTEIPAPGGATAAGLSPTPTILSGTATTVAGGAGPAAQTVAGQGGSPATGFAPTVRTILTPGGAVSVSLSPSALVTFAAGGAIASGRQPTEFFPGAVIIQSPFDAPSPIGLLTGSVSPTSSSVGTTFGDGSYGGAGYSGAGGSQGAFDPPVPIGQLS